MKIATNIKIPRQGDAQKEVAMQNLKVTEYKDIRVLTTQQIAEAYGTETQVITNNFNRNKERYSEGKHFICLTGNEKAEFINKNQKEFSSFVRAKAIYLWTEKGAFLHAKSLNTDTAWEVYDRLVDSYFNSHSAPAPVVEGLSPQLQLLINMELKQKEQDAKLTALEDKFSQHSEVLQTVKEAMTSAAHEKDLGKWVTECIGRIANSAAFEDNPYRYQCAWKESYDRLTSKAGCRLDTLLKHAKERAAQNGAPKSKINAISKLSVIADNRRLKELYISCIREMMAAYCIEDTE